jgi:hypothetical protein
MPYPEPHPSDQELLMSAGAELPPGRADAVRLHLASCHSCRIRFNHLEGALTDFARVHRREFDAKIPPIAPARAKLRARLAAQSGTSVFDLRTPRHSWWFASAAMVVLAAGVAQLRNHHTSEFTLLETAAIPRPKITPGATVPVTKQQVCSAASRTEGPAVPASLQHQIFEAYGIAHPRPDAYEIDYLITPDLGGAANIRNLWPQPYHDTVWNARVKDQLEERLHNLVCTGQLDLTTAQHDLATDWVTAYKRYFHTNHPRPSKPQMGQRRTAPGNNRPAEIRWQLASSTIPRRLRPTPCCIAHIRLHPSTAKAT